MRNLYGFFGAVLLFNATKLFTKNWATIVKSTLSFSTLSRTRISIRYLFYLYSRLFLFFVSGYTTKYIALNLPFRPWVMFLIEKVVLFFTLRFGFWLDSLVIQRRVNTFKKLFSHSQKVYIEFWKFRIFLQNFYDKINYIS